MSGGILDLELGGSLKSVIKVLEVIVRPRGREPTGRVELEVFLKVSVT